MHPANQRLRKPDKLSQGPHKQTSYPRVQWENTLDKREATEPQNNNKQKDFRSRAREKPERGECKVREQEQEHRTTHAAGD